MVASSLAIDEVLRFLVCVNERDDPVPWIQEEIRDVSEPRRRDFIPWYESGLDRQVTRTVIRGLSRKASASRVGGEEQREALSGRQYWETGHRNV